MNDCQYLNLYRNFKGIYYMLNSNHYYDKKTGAHFDFLEASKKLEVIKNNENSFKKIKKNVQNKEQGTELKLPFTKFESLEIPFNKNINCLARTLKNSDSTKQLKQTQNRILQQIKPSASNKSNPSLKKE